VYAIIEDRGTQIKVTPGDVVEIDLTDRSETGAAVTFDRVLLIGGTQAGSASVGTPYIDGASVQAEVVGEVAGDKLRTNKYSRRKGYRRQSGHRQRFTRVKITGISG
jgi:large subunit ribosomal protein L21